MTNEFRHYDGCRHRDPDNCGACALTDTRQAVPNYAAWPLAYMENGRIIPAKWKAAFFAETRGSNRAYAENVLRTLNGCSDESIHWQLFAALRMGLVWAGV